MKKLGTRILGLDYGDKTIGVAVSDSLGVIALGVETICRDREFALRSSIRRLAELVAEYAPVDTIVLGYPKNMDNTIGERCKKTLAFRDKLSHNFKDIPIVLWDERLSTAGARRALSGNVAEKAVIDEIAAVFILQGYIERSEHMTEDNIDSISMLDEDGNEAEYRILSTKKDGDCLYMLAEEDSDDEDSEVLIFKCIEDDSQGDEEDVVFELVEADHESFEAALALFKNDFVNFGIILE